MGNVSRRGIPTARELGCDVDTLVHLGALNHRGIKDLTGYYNEWRKVFEIVPEKVFQ